MDAGDSFVELLREAGEHPVVGWDFSWLGDRLSTRPLPWDYEALLVERARRSADLLDLGTGGGELLAGLAHRPPRTVATEAWPPNVEVARRRLGPLGVAVVAVEGAPDNDRQAPDATPARLPFPDRSFTLVASRHESYVPDEVARVLAPGGVFLTQQVGADHGDVYEALGLRRPPARRWSLALARAQLEGTGLHVRGCGETTGATTFADVGALAWYLEAVPWTVEGFSVATHRARLERLHRRLRDEGPLTVRQPAFWLEATRPS